MPHSNSHITADLLDPHGNPITPTSTSPPHLPLRRTASGKLVPAASPPHSLRRVGGITSNGLSVPVRSASTKPHSPTLLDTRPSNERTNCDSERSVASPNAATQAPPCSSAHDTHANAHTPQHLNPPHSPGLVTAAQTPYPYPWQSPDSLFHAVSPPSSSTTLRAPEQRTEDSPSMRLPASASVKLVSSPARRVEVAEMVRGVDARTAVLEGVQEDVKGKDGVEQECDIWCEVAEWIRGGQ